MAKLQPLLLHWICLMGINSITAIGGVILITTPSDNYGHWQVLANPDPEYIVGANV